MRFAVGSLVTARGRDWVVLPDPRNSDDLLIVRPLVGGDEEVTGIYLPMEPEDVVQAGFPLPDPAADLGNHRSGALLRDAMRLALRSAAGPLRSLGQIAVEPRPYQLVPLLMALRLDPIRLLIADDVGIGKSIEAALVARELLDRGEIERLSVLCPPHLAEQWQRTLGEQFQIDAELVLPGTVRRLERRAGLGAHQSLFAHYRHTVVSLDYIKSDRHRHLLLQDPPDLLIVDEAHTCALADDARRQRHQRHQLLQELMRDETRHLLLVTATPHSGKESHFRSLLSLLAPDFAALELDERRHRERLARHLVQRRRGDLKRYLDRDTPFPTRDAREARYRPDEASYRLFKRVLAWCRESIAQDGGGDTPSHRQRVRWWGALALLRALASSPAAAKKALRNRSPTADTLTPEEADAVGRHMLFDLDDESSEGTDVTPGTGVEEDLDEAPVEGRAARERELRLRLAREVEKLEGAKDVKLKRAIEVVRELLDDGYAPIIFCRFIPTVHYLAEHLAKSFPGVEVAAVTGESHPAARERAVLELAAHERRILVSTDCLSEGINLQQGFDAVMHYDLSWNPTRHEQREGRVDRYGQKRATVRTVTFYGESHPVDRIVVKVLLRKHQSIRRDLGYSVPVPMESDTVTAAFLEELMQHGEHNPEQLSFAFAESGRQELEKRWDQAAEREKRSRSLFAQNTINEKDVAQELAASRAVLGDVDDARRFVAEALPALGGSWREERGLWRIELDEAPRAVRQAAGASRFTASLDGHGAPALTRAHPVVRALADHVWDAALDPQISGPARRCGVVRSRAVDRRTTLLLLRLRFHIHTRDRRGQALPLLAEEVVLAAFSGAPGSAVWLSDEDARTFLDILPDRDREPNLDAKQLRDIFAELAVLTPALRRLADEHADRLLDAHRRVRQATTRRRDSVASLRVEPCLATGDPPLDLLGVYLYLPVVGGGA